MLYLFSQKWKNTLDDRNQEITEILDHFEHNKPQQKNHENVLNSHQSVKDLIKEQLNKLNLMKERTKSLEALSTQLASLITNSLTEIPSLTDKLQLENLKNNIESKIKELVSEKDAFSEGCIKLRNVEILLSNCERIISSGNDLVKRVDQIILALQEDELESLHKLHGCLASERKWLTGARAMFSLDLMGIEDETEMALQMEKKQKCQKDLPKHERNLKELYEICERLKKQGVTGYEEPLKVCEELNTDFEEVKQLSLVQDKAFEAAMSEENEFYAQLETLYTWMEKVTAFVFSIFSKL